MNIHTLRTSLDENHHRNFGRGGAGAVMGSKNLVAVTALGKRQTTFFDADAFQKLSKELDAQVKAHVGDPGWTADGFVPAEKLKAF